MQPLIYEGVTCPDGVEIVYEGSNAARETAAAVAAKTRSDAQASQLEDYLGAAFRYRSDRRIPVRIERANLEDPVVIAFVNAATDAELQTLFSRYGLLHPRWLVPRLLFEQSPGATDQAATGYGYIRDMQKHLLTALEDAGTDWIKGRSNAVLETSERVAVTPFLAFGGHGNRPVLSLKMDNLEDFMMMECMLIAEQGARLTKCEHCHDAFLTGPLTWRRSHARFCSDRCRVAAMRARNTKRGNDG